MRSTNESVEWLVERAGVLLGPDHFRLRSGRHSRYYFDKDRLIALPRLLDRLTYELATKLLASRAEVIIGSAMGGAFLAIEVARHLSLLCGNQHEVYGVFADKTHNSAIHIRDYFRGLINGQRVVLVDDTVTTGDSIAELRHQVIESGGQVVGLGVICNRRQLTAEDIGITPFCQLLDLSIEDYAAGSGCPMCREGILLNTTVGHSREFLKRRQELLPARTTP
ncbi:MAG: hypothetical protein HY481_01755 [Candidatus Vogelbacteria bacterium]|nr:hypothetical protein [Candidatus Vogelbacteria bacterium]